MTDRKSHPIPDKAEVSIDFREKFYMGSFTRDSRFEAAAENDGLMIRLVHPGDDRREVAVHLHHLLLADILESWAASLAGQAMEEAHRATLLAAVKGVETALRNGGAGVPRRRSARPGKARKR